MTTHDLITAVLAAFAAIAGFLIEWRRIGNDAARIAELEAHVANLEAFTGRRESPRPHRSSALKRWQAEANPAIITE